MTTTVNKTYYKQLEKLNAFERELYRVLKKYMDNITHKCFPSIETLRIEFKYSRTTTKKYLAILEEKGYIHIRQRKVKHRVTNNKFNETNEYTLLLEKFKGNIKPGEKTKKDSKPLTLKETDLEGVVKQLKESYSKESISSALKTMRRNVKNGYPVKFMKNYLETIMDASASQLKQIDKAIGKFTQTLGGTSSKKPKGNNKYTSSKVNTKFHNFKQRTNQYNADELEKKVLQNHKSKRKE